MEDSPLKLLREIEAGAKAIGVAPSSLCLAAVGNGYLHQRLKAGGDFRSQTAKKVRAYIKKRMEAKP